MTDEGLTVRAGASAYSSDQHQPWVDENRYWLQVESQMSDFDSLTLALEEWFDRLLGEFPEPLRKRAEQELSPLRWEELSPEQRRSAALQRDYQRDPATEQERKDWWTFFHRMDELEAELQRQRPGDRVNLDDLLFGTGPLKDVRDQIRRMKVREQRAKAEYYPQRRLAVQAAEPGRYMAYPKALQALKQSLNATPEEMAAWVFMGADDGGLSAYLNVNELDPPPQFRFGALAFFGNASEGDSDYVAPLMGCWFKSVDVVRFEPADRFITGQALVERWGSISGVKVEAFIRAKIRETRLVDLHPIYGGTQAGGLGDAHLPPMAEGLFRLAEIEAIELEDFGGLTEPSGGSSAQDVPVEAANESAPSAGLPEFLSMSGLAPEEIRMAFVGDTTESGLAGNSMLEISARDVTKRVPLSMLGLTDRRSGALNAQGAVLVGMARGLKLDRSNDNSAKMARLRKVFRSYLGVDDPFFPFNASDGWAPRFKLLDRRDASADRAQRYAERKTVSLEQFLDNGGRTDANLTSEDLPEPEGDEADRWLNENDPTAKR